MMQNEVTDLKLYISTELKEQTTQIRRDFHKEIARLDTKIDKLILDVADALELYYGNHEVRILKLESRKA